jgi:hypothetical protein
MELMLIIIDGPAWTSTLLVCTVDTDGEDKSEDWSDRINVHVSSSTDSGAIGISTGDVSVENIDKCK